MGPFTVLALAAVLLVSGCAGPGDAAPAGTGSSVPTEAPPATATLETGGIDGLVVDDEQQGIAGADVGLVETQVTTRSDSTGRFSFSGLAPGEYRIQVGAIGYDTTAKRVAVVAGEVAPVSFVLESILEDEPIISSVPLKGYLNCSFNPYYSVNLCGNALPDQAHFPFTIRKDLAFKEVVIELVWTPGSPATGQRLELNLCDRLDNQTNQANCFTAEQFYNWTSGTSPRIMRNSDKGNPAMPIKDVQDYQISVGAGQLTTGSATVPPIAFQQNFDLYLTTCYVAKCPDEFQARPPT